MEVAMAKTKQEIEDACEDLLKDFDNTLNWKWDERFEALLAQFSVKHQDKIIPILEKHFKSKWDKKSIRNAPAVVKKNTQTFKNMQPGQLLFTSETENKDLVYAAWWPWGDGESISVRVLSTKFDTIDAEEGGFLNRLKKIFK